tara:strand:- start:150 stop:365 length:216 start_codon:yes stop_codon:yes gene_type:complete
MAIHIPEKNTKTKVEVREHALEFAYNLLRNNRYAERDSKRADSKTNEVRPITVAEVIEEAERVCNFLNGNN